MYTYLLYMYIRIDYHKIVETIRLYCLYNCDHGYTGHHRKHSHNTRIQFKCEIEPQFQCFICEKRIKQNLKLKIIL